jgi:protease I
LRLNKDVLAMVKHFGDAGKPIAAICHGAQVLTAAGIAKGRKISCYPACSPEVTEAGGEYVGVDWGEAVTDRNLVTGPAWTAHVEWLRQFLAVLGTRIAHEATAKA